MSNIERISDHLPIDHEAVLKELGLNPRDPKAQALVLVADRYGLDPILKHVILVKGNVYITRAGYLHIAHSSGQFDGIEVVDIAETDTHWTAKVSVYRRDMSRPITYPGRYPKDGQQAKAYGPEMAVTRAEVNALRRAFDVDGIDPEPEYVGEEAYQDGPANPVPDPGALRRRANAELGKLGKLDGGSKGHANVEGCCERHDTIAKATNGTTRSTDQLGPADVDAIAAYVAAHRPKLDEAPGAKREPRATAEQVASLADLLAGLREAGDEWVERGRAAWKEAGLPPVRDHSHLTTSEASRAEELLGEVYRSAVAAA